MPATIGMSAASATSRSIESSNRPITREAMKDRKSTRLNSSHSQISYAVFCLKKKKTRTKRPTLGYTTVNCNIINQPRIPQTLYFRHHYKELLFPQVTHAPPNKPMYHAASIYT